MGRPLQGFGFFYGNKRFDAELDNFEKIKVHAFLEQDEEPAAWVAKKDYSVNDKVKKGTKNYICITANNQATFLAVEKAPAAWVAGKEYKVGDKVLQDGTDYICKEAHTSSDAFTTDVAKWDEYELVVYWAEYELGGGKLEDCLIVKQTGFNKYLVCAIADNKRQGIVELVDGEANATKTGTAYIVVTDTAENRQHNARKIVRNVIETFDGNAYTYKYEVSEDVDNQLEGAFNVEKDDVECYPEVNV